jgi:hypothetical protein
MLAATLQPGDQMKDALTTHSSARLLEAARRFRRAGLRRDGGKIAAASGAHSAARGADQCD